MLSSERRLTLGLGAHYEGPEPVDRNVAKHPCHLGKEVCDHIGLYLRGQVHIPPIHALHARLQSVNMRKLGGLLTSLGALKTTRSI